MKSIVSRLNVVSSPYDFVYSVLHKRKYLMGRFGCYVHCILFSMQWK